MPDIARSSKMHFNVLTRRPSAAFLFPTKEVCFASVQVREYPVILGDNPSCTSGPPLTLDWNYNAELSCTIDEWERRRDTTRHLRVPSSVRMEYLLDTGFTLAQVLTAIQDVEKCQRLRFSSIETSSLQEKACDVVECLKRHFEPDDKGLVRTERCTNLGDILIPLQLQES
ncbi:hypothetical protein ACHAXA_010822 [Cyclostephanos tholiformis]|uniref:Uncharacterized protein n=1 Tax=Cyclostephanos tholiformis TaxID=382380 RepID=A0ABD3SG91_9STRA